MSSPQGSGGNITDHTHQSAGVQGGTLDAAAIAAGTLPVTRGGTGETTSSGTGATIKQTSPTIVTPTIASLVNMQHSHTNAASGGTLTATLPKGYRQGWRMSNGGTINQVSVAAGKGRDDADASDISTGAGTTLDLSTTGAGGRMAADTLTNASWWKIYMIAGSGQTTLPFAVKDGSTVTLPASYTDKAFVGFTYYIDATAGLIDFDHGDDGFVRFKLAAEMVENLDVTDPNVATVWTAVTLSIHADIKVALVSLVHSRVGAIGAANRTISIRPNGWTWTGGAAVDPAPGDGIGSWDSDATDIPVRRMLAIPAPGKIIEYIGDSATRHRIRIYTAGFFNGVLIL